MFMWQRASSLAGQPQAVRQQGHWSMTEIDLARAAQRFAEISDGQLLEDYSLGPDGFTHPPVWQLLVAEMQRRGLRTADEVAQDLAFEAAAQANPDAAGAALFCDACRATTIAEASGDTHLVRANPIFAVGDTLLGRSDVCPSCGSYVARLWFVFIVPIAPVARYRVIDLGNGRFVSRRLVAA